MNFSAADIIDEEICGQKHTIDPDTGFVTCCLFLMGIDRSCDETAAKKETSGWSRIRCDHRNTGRCNFDGPSSLNVLWMKQLDFNAGGIISDSHGVHYGLGRDTEDEGYFVSFDADGTRRWSIPAGYYRSWPSMDPQGRIYAAELYPKDHPESKGIVCLDADGTVIWVNSEQRPRCIGGLNFSPDYSVLYVPTYEPPGTVRAVDTKTGHILWKYDLAWTTATTPAVGNDGTIYQADSFTWLYALTPSGELKWKIELYPDLHTVGEPLVIGNDGTIYVKGIGGDLNDPLIAVNPDGTIRWKKGFDWYGGGRDAVAIDCNGNIVNSNRGTIYCMTPQGETLWSTYLSENEGEISELYLDKSGRIYVQKHVWLYILDENGIVLDSWAIPPEFRNTYSTYLSPDGLWYFFNVDGVLIALGDPGTAPGFSTAGTISLILVIGLLLVVHSRRRRRSISIPVIRSR